MPSVPMWARPHSGVTDWMFSGHAVLQNARESRTPIPGVHGDTCPRCPRRHLSPVSTETPVPGVHGDTYPLVLSIPACCPGDTDPGKVSR
ncbi:unnamed protein product [Boreogadus saida]